MLTDMSSCPSCLNSDPAIHQSRKIDKELRKQRKHLKRQVKILLLGSGESGKSTFLKQMVIIHGRGEFTADEVREYRQYIYQNVVSAMRVLIDARQKLGFSWQKPQLQTSAERILAFTPTEIRSIDSKTFGELAPLIRDLWADDAIRLTYEQRNLFQITDSCSYFFDHINRTALADFFPTNRDILLCRKATRGISETTIDVQNVPFRFVDVGGQRSQRQKWFQCFHDITCILFLVASCEYDQVILEDRRTNRLSEARSVFETIVNNRAFQSVAIILFLNKTDLLCEKVEKSDIRQYFHDYRGDPNSIIEVQRFMLDLFESSRKDRRKPFFYHYTTAVDTENIRKVFKDCREIILEQNLKALMMH